MAPRRSRAVFELVSPHARGSMGEVHRGRDLQTGDTVR
jgi:hypothetical protein